jgi:hypothetical protein
MSLSTVEIRIASANPSLVELQATGSPAIVQINMGPSGPAGASGGSTNAWNYNAKTNATSGYPGNGYLLWNNATQTSATSILVSHLADDDTDIELLLSFFVINQKIFIQDRDDSSKNQVWLISGTPTVTGANTSTAYYTFPVTLVSSAGGAFTNNHSLLFGQIVVATNAVTSATTSDGTATLSTSTLTTGALTVSTSGVFNATSYTYGTGAASAMRTALDVLPRTSVITVTGTTPPITEPLIEQNSQFNGKRYWTGGDSSVEYDGTDWLVHAFDGVNNYDANFASTTDEPWNISAAAWNVTNGSGQPTLSIDRTALFPNENNSGTMALVADQDGQIRLSDVIGLGSNVSTALAINIGSSGAMVTSNSTDTLTNKTLTSPAINSATIGTAVTFDSTSYTYGTGAAAAHRTALGLTTLATTTPAVNVATFLETPTSANLAAAVTGETGSGALVFGTSPSLTSPTIDTSATFNATTYTYGAGAAAAHRDALGVAGKQSKTTTSAVTSNNATAADITDLTGFVLEANTTYRLTLHSIITTSSGGSFEFLFIASETTYQGGISQAGAGVQRSGAVLNGGYHYSTTSFSPLYATQNLSNGHTYGEYYFRTSGTAGTAKMQFAQRSSAVSGTTTIAAGTTAILEKIS